MPVGLADQGLRLTLEFHTVYDLDINDRPHIHNAELNKLRLDLLKEELQELEDALEAHDPVETFDALLDLQYVLDGTFWALGFAHVKSAGLNRVHDSNMSKLDVDGSVIRRDDGKVLKGPNFFPPNLRSLL